MFGRTKTESHRESHRESHPRESHPADETQVQRPLHDDTMHDDGDTRGAAVDDAEQHRRDRFGGINWGADFFGWLVAVAVTLLLAGILGAIAAAAGADEDLLPTDSAEEIGILAGAVLVAVLMVGYYAGGYVAGRMSRFDGGRQGFGVWLIGLIVTALAVAAGTLLGNEYNVLDRVDLPSIPLSTDTMTWGGVVVAAAVLVGSLIAALAGGRVGRHYHTRVDRAGH